MANLFARQYSQQMIPGRADAASQASNAVTQKRPPYLAIGLIAVVAVIVLFAVKMLFFQDNYETPVKNLMKSIEKQDIPLLLSVFPSEVLEAAADELDMDREEMEETMDDMISGISEEYDGRIRIKYEIEDDHRLKNSEMRDIEDDMFNTVEIKDGRRLEISTDIYIDGDKEEEDDIYLRVIKVGRKWYIDPTSMSAW